MKTIRNLICFCLFAAATSMFAQIDIRPLMKVNVPFQFTVNDHVLPAGEYVISAVQPERTIRISSVHGKNSAILAVSPLYARHVFEKTSLTFNRYGGTYFLEEVQTAGQDVARTLPKGKREMEMASNSGQPKSTTVLAELTGR
jgi:hypothetical protein